MVKSEAEIEKLAHICAIGSRTFAQVPEFAQEGQPLEDVFRAFRREGLTQGADDVPYLVGGADKGGAADRPAEAPPPAQLVGRARRAGGWPDGRAGHSGTPGVCAAG